MFLLVTITSATDLKCFWPRNWVLFQPNMRVFLQYSVKLIKPKLIFTIKITHTGQYVHFKSFEPWYRKTAWVKSLVERAERICSNKHLFETEQILEIKSFMSWNGYPICVCNSVLKRLRERKKNSRLSKMRVAVAGHEKNGLQVPRCGCSPEMRVASREMQAAVAKCGLGQEKQVTCNLLRIQLVLKCINGSS